MMTTRQVVVVVVVKAVAVVVTMAAPITVMTSVAVTAGHTASLSTRAKKYIRGCANILARPLHNGVNK